MKLVDRKLKEWISNSIVRANVRNVIIEEMNNITYTFWLGGIPIDIDGREKLTLEESMRLVKKYIARGYDDIAVVENKKK
tara:strand:- start:122 stop:361 length:240 start_codon:yes stop_codon:yes gene_type:complete